MGEKPSPLGEDFSFNMYNISGFNPAGGMVVDLSSDSSVGFHDVQYQ